MFQDDFDETPENITSFEKKFSQYFQNPDGFQPTVTTVSALPSSLYSIQWDSEHRNVVYAPQNLDTDKIVDLPSSLTKEICEDIELFWEKSSVFSKLGLVHKRGILLYGLPGTGKTTAVNLIIKQIIKRGGVAFNFYTSMSNCIALLRQFRNIEPTRPAVVVLEDIDKRIKEDDSLVWILQMLDGNYQINNVVFMATTNYPEILDTNLVNRPGRFDKILKISVPDFLSRELYLRSYNILSQEELKVWSDSTDGLTVAHIRELIISVKIFGKDFDECLLRLRKMTNHPKQPSTGTIGLIP